MVGAKAYEEEVTTRILDEQKLRVSEEENRLLYEAMNQGIALHEVIWNEFGMPIDYRYISVNSFYEKMTGLDRDDLIGRRVSEVLPLTEDYWWDAFAEVALSRKPKRIVNYSSELGKHYSISFYSPQPNQVAGIVDDVTDLFETQNQLLESESRYKILAEQSSTVIWEINHEGIFLYVSPVINKLLGFTPEELVGKMGYTDLFAKDNISDAIKIIHDYMENPTSTDNIERILITKDKRQIWVETYISSVRDEKGEIIKYRGSDKDITERKKRHDEIIYINNHDYLTKLYNRLYFDKALKELDVEQNMPICIIMGDLNGLKLINDAFGHAVGDSMLITVAQALTEVFYDGNIIARLGGDEFGIILTNTNEIDAIELIKKAKQIIENEDLMGVKGSISFGIACKTKNIPLSSVLITAEDDMYARKLFEMTSHRSENIKTILKTLHEKNQREEEHSKRVSLICTELGKALGMSTDELNLLNVISNLHDIGKIAIDEAILNKPGKLDENEWEIIKRHPEIGYRILSSSSEYADVAIDILSHHERYDGKGYPRGMRGEEIPFRARIIAIADAYDAMISMRTYRSSLSHEEAILEILKCKGTQFDPNLVDIFLKLPRLYELH